MVEEERLNNVVHSIGKGRGFSNKELSKEIAAIVEYRLNRIMIGYYPQGYPMRPPVSNQPYLVLDSKRLKSDTDRTPSASIDRFLNLSIKFNNLGV